MKSPYPTAPNCRAIRKLTTIMETELIALPVSWLIVFPATIARSDPRGNQCLNMRSLYQKRDEQGEKQLSLLKGQGIVIKKTQNQKRRKRYKVYHGMENKFFLSIRNT